MNKIKKDAHNNKKECAFFMKKDKKEEQQVEEGIAEVGEDATKYGEFISSYFAWVSLPEQKEKVEKLEEITEKKNKTSKK